MTKIISYFNLFSKLSIKNDLIRSCSSVVKHKPETSVVNLRKEVEDDLHQEISRLKLEPKDDALARCTKDISDLAPYTKPTFNFAAYVNKSETLQKLVKLGVDLSRIEKKPEATELILKLDFERDMKEHIFYLHNLGVDADHLGWYLTKNPFIFKEDLENLTIRINYLKSKAFTNEMIESIIKRNPFWLNFSTVRIDGRLGFFQKKFSLTGDELRTLTMKESRLITYSLNHVTVNTFAIKEEMGFDDEQIKNILLKKPRIWMRRRDSIVNTFDYIHNTMNIQHEFMVEMPEVLLCRKSRLQQRHQFLTKLGRAQYDPKQVNYIALNKLVEGTDSEFCADVAKSTVQSFNVFLKSL